MASWFTLKALIYFKTDTDADIKTLLQTVPMEKETDSQTFGQEAFYSLHQWATVERMLLIIPYYSIKEKLAFKAFRKLFVTQD